MNNASRILLALSLALFPLACTTTVIGGGTGADGTAGGPTSSNPSGGNPSGGNPTPVDPPAPASPTAVAYSGAALETCINQMSGSGTTGSSSSGGPDMGTLFLTVGSPVSCTCPFSSGDCGSWEVTIGLPPESQQAGTVVDLTDSTNSSFGETAASDPPSTLCEGGGGSFVGGTIEIVSIDGSQVTFTLSGTMPLDFGIGSVDGTYTATRCP